MTTADLRRHSRAEHSGLEGSHRQARARRRASSAGAGMELTVIGCSGSFAGPQSPASCYLISGQDAEGRTWRLIMDLGSGGLGALQQMIDLPQIDGILLSHLHPDHCIDLAGLHIAVRWDPRGWPGERIPLWCPPGTHEYLAFTHGLDTDPGLSGSFDFRHWAEAEPVRIGPFSVEAHRVLHPIEHPYALRVTYHGPAGDEVLAYSGDTDAAPGLVRAAKDADLFLCEAAYQEGRDDHLRGIHLTGRRAGQAAAEAGARRLVLTHLPVWNDPQVVRAEAEEVYEGPVSLAQAGASYAVAPQRG